MAARGSPPLRAAPQIGNFPAVLIELAIIRMLLPRNIRVERSVAIARPASLIYATVNSFQRFAPKPMGPFIERVCP